MRLSEKSKKLKSDLQSQIPGVDPSVPSLDREKLEKDKNVSLLTFDLGFFTRRTKAGKERLREGSMAPI